MNCNEVRDQMVTYIEQVAKDYLAKPKGNKNCAYRENWWWNLETKKVIAEEKGLLKIW